MANQKPNKNQIEQEEKGFQLLQKIEDMIVYALPLIEKWTIPHQKLLGDDMAQCMNRMLELASALTVAYYKKTTISELDEANKGLQGYIRVAYRLKYLKGISSRNEWEKRSSEIGKMIGEYKKWVYGDNSSSSKSGNQKSSR